LFDRSYECRESISGIFEAKLVTADAEWLAGRASDHNFRVGVTCFGGEELLIAMAHEISVVGVAAIWIGFESYRFESGSFKAESQSTTARE
jgi:hypothetical protein